MHYQRSQTGVFSGSVYTTGTYNTSDEKLKENIRPYDNALSSIAQLDVKTYEFKTNGILGKMNFPKGDQVGLMAQNLEQLFPALVNEGVHHDLQTNSGEVTFKAVNYTGLIPVLIKGMQEQQAQIEALKKQIAELKASK